MQFSNLIAIFVFSFSPSILAEAPKDLPWSPLPKVAPAPKNNPSTPEKINLGKQLFFDPRLSMNGTVSCNSCHNVMSNGTDNRANSVGVEGKLGGRSAPTVWNAAFHSVQFWDGRAATLEDQAKGPITNPVEMAMTDHDFTMKRISQIPGYVQQFSKVFGKNGLNIDNAAKAIAAYERTLITPNSPFDRYMKGDKKAISAKAAKGMKTVMEVGCITCHTGMNFNGSGQAVGEGNYQKFPLFPDNNPYIEKYKLAEDKGRQEATKNSDDAHYFRVPTWRNVALTAPYFHNGSVGTLEEAVRVMAKSQLDKTLTDEQVSNIVEFLNTLTGEFPQQTMPRLPETPGKTFFEVSNR